MGAFKFNLCAAVVATRSFPSLSLSALSLLRLLTSFFVKRIPTSIEIRIRCCCRAFRAHAESKSNNSQPRTYSYLLCTYIHTHASIYPPVEFSQYAVLWRHEHQQQHRHNHHVHHRIAIATKAKATQQQMFMCHR